MKFYKEIKHSVGAKLFLSGEYSITYPNQKAIILFIPKYTYATIFESNEYKIYSDLFEYSINLDALLDANYQLIIDLILFINKYLHELNIKPKKFNLHINSELYHNSKKYGLGSSGAIVVLVTKCILSLHNLSFTKLQLFKLCAIFLTLRNDNGSFGDLACICFEKNIIYTNFNRNFINSNTNITKLLSYNFNSLDIKPFSFSFPVKMHIIWTKIEAKSSNLIKAVNLNNAFLAESNYLINQYLNCSNLNDLSTIISKNRTLLQNLSNLIEIDEIKQICEECFSKGIPCKSSGAGGGDCCIAFTNVNEALTTNYPIIMEVQYE